MREIPYPRIVDRNMNTLRRIIPQSVSIDLKAVPLSYASMKLSQNESIPERSYVELYTCMGSAGVFRVTAPQNAYGDDNITVELEHAITELGDYLVLEDIDEMMPAASAVSRIFHHYRGNKWTMSTSGSGLGSGEVAVEVDHDNVLESLLGIIEQIENCIMTFDFTTTPWTFGFKKMDSTVTAEGRLSRNVQSAKVTYDDSELCTRVYYEVSSGSGADATTEWKYKDTGTASKYGLIEKVCSTGSNYTESEALRVVNSFIRRNKRPRVSISINAEELSNVTGEQLDKFTIGKLFRLALPDYNVEPIEENITGLSFRDVYGRPDDIVVDLADEEDTVVTYIHDTTDSTTGNGRSSGGRRKKEEETWKEFRTLFYRDDYHIAMAAQHLDEHNNILQQAGLYIDSEGILQYADDNANMLYSRIQQTASSIMHEVEDAYNGLYSRITQTASEIRSDVANVYNGLYTRITQTADSIQSNVADVYNGLYTRIVQTASDIRSEVATETGSIRTLVRQTASSWESRVEGVVDENGNVTAGSIALAINNGGTTATIDATHIVLGSEQTAETVINSLVTRVNTLEATYIKTDELSAKIAELATVNVISLSASGNISATGAIMGSNVYFGSAGSYTSVGNAIATIGVASENDGAITIPTTKLNGEQGTPINFNIAATQYFIDGVAANRASDVGSVQTTDETAIQMLSEYNTKYKIQTRYKRYDGTWANGSGYVVLTPPDRFQEGYDTGNAHRASDVGSIESTSETAVKELSSYNTKYKIQTRYKKADNTWANGGSYVVLTPADRYQTGFDDGKPVSATLGSKTSTTGIYYNVLVNQGNGGQKALEVDLSAAYTAARSGYTLGTFTQATITLQGAAHADITPITGITKYKKVTNLYKSGSKTTYYKGDGSKYSAAVCYARSKGPQLTHYSNTTLYYKSGSSYYTAGTHDWYYSNSAGTQYYTTSSLDHYLKPDSDGAYQLKGNTVDVYPRTGSAMTGYVKDTSGTVELGSAGTKVTGLYDAGESSTDYYTKS